ncbi:hypothetical protein RclHR1_11600001 [Rhizophagus clarus]|uniref:F-box domain-containing protein n=1 Tax=Rhizophagus clarus TaxID=94130 RepID=A0A2Z6QXP4_9GLOM|nr:hypothetical protein RclHR1_11600001 [Rhizophagus clarus]
MSCSKIFSGDLPELTYGIIKYFHSDFATLHSCILVNRLWCNLAIPLLWENPFSIPTENYNFIKIYLNNYLNDDDLKTKFNEYKIIYNLSPSNTLFNYPRFLKYLNTFEIISCIKSWSGFLKHERPKFIRLVYTTLFKIFIENELNLRIFEIEISVRYYDYFNDISELILQNTTFIYNIKNLNLHIGYSDDSLHYRNTSSDKHILIRNRILQIINSHQNFKEISLCYYPLYLSLLNNYNYSNTLKSIILCHVDFKGITNLTEIFEQLHVLESVHILYCISLNISFVQQIINLTKPFKLKSLLVDRLSQIEPLELLLRKSGDYLENFGFDFPNTNGKPLLLQQLLELTVKYCKNINYLYLSGIVSQITYLVLKLIENNQNLNYLFISTGFDSTKIECGSIILQNLGQILPSKLEYLNLFLAIEESDFEIFLKNSQDTFIRKLLFYSSISQNILPSIKEHIMKKKRTKYLATVIPSSEEALLFDECTDLMSLDDEVKEFGLYNIEVKGYYFLQISLYDFIRGID